MINTFSYFLGAWLVFLIGWFIWTDIKFQRDMKKLDIEMKALLKKKRDLMSR